MKYWCELAWLGGDRVEAGALVTVEDGRVHSLELGVSRAPRDATRLGGVTIPGFGNAHSHAFQRALRGRTQDERGSFWSWRDRMYETAARLQPDSYLKLARGTFAEMALAGITAVGEFHYLHRDPEGVRYAHPNAMGEAVIEAARQVGIRITLLDACYLRGGIGEPLSRGQRRFSDGDVEGWIERVDELEDRPMAKIGAAIHSIRAVDPQSAGRVVDWVRDRPLHAHVSEQRAENEACIDAYGVTPTQVLADEGALDRAFTAIHATHVTQGDLELLSGSGCTVCLCPTTERDLADGVGPAGRMHDAGVKLALGSDSHAVIDHFEEAPAVELDERLVSGRRGIHRPVDLLTHATAGGYASLGWDAAGLEAGMLADFVSVGLDSVRLAGAEREQLPTALVFSATAADVRDVIVGGELIVRDGALLSLTERSAR